MDKTTEMVVEKIKNMKTKLKDQEAEIRQLRAENDRLKKELQKSNTLQVPAGPSRSPSPSLCVVCGDKAGYKNFGVASCEGCKSFFKRYAGKDLASFRCDKTGNCEITVATRNECRHCRLSKCVAAGMRANSREPSPKTPI